MLDALWERFKTQHRWAQLWDRIPDQTHIHHTLLIILLGAVGWIFGVYTLGIAVGLGLYTVREIWNQLELAWTGEPLRLWDGAMDVLVPVWITYPTMCLWLPGWLLLTLLVALLYGPWRRDER